MHKNETHAIAMRAYYKWVNEGRPCGQDLRHWYEAEQELTRSDVDLEELIEVTFNEKYEK